MLTLDPLRPVDASHPRPKPASDPVPICVDLDGTLVKSDTLQDAMILLLRHRPWKLFAALPLLLKSKARFKQQITHLMPLDVHRLPWNRAVLRYIREERASGRTIVLATGADQALAHRVARHLSCFDLVLASDGHLNLIGSQKLAILQQLFPVFDYIGNSASDTLLLDHARRAVVANPSPLLILHLRHQSIPVEVSLTDRASPLRSSLAALRPHQWAKNLLLLLPLLLSHRFSLHSAITSILAFCAFASASSLGYVFNDLLDLENDRNHPRKRMRPFASGDRTVVDGLLLALALLTVTSALLPLLPAAFAAWTAAYLALTTMYSMWFKRIAIADVLLLSGLYLLRLYAGGAATATAISPWLAGFALFFFLSLAMLKRLSELEILRQRGGGSAPGRGYRVADIDLIRIFGLLCAYTALLVFAMYIRNPEASALYPHAERLWLILPLLLFWLLRIWLLASRGEVDEDPVLFAIADPTSVLLGIAIAALTWTAAH